MNIRFGCVTLRAIDMQDLDLLLMLMNSPDVERTTVGMNYAVSSLNQEEWMRGFHNSDGCLRWMIELENGRTLGMISFTDIDWINRSASIGIKINPEERERIRGDVKDAMYAAHAYAFDELNLERLESATLDFNIFSLKLSRSMGYVDEGIQRKKIFKNGKRHDLVIGGLLREEFVRYEDGRAPWQVKRNQSEGQAKE